MVGGGRLGGGFLLISFYFIYYLGLATVMLGWKCDVSVGGG